MSPLSAQTDLFRQLAQTPLADRSELAALSGWSPSAIYGRIARLERAGLVEHVIHASPSTPATRRYCLSAAGVRSFAEDSGIGLRRALAQHPVSNEWRRLLFQRLDTAALLYRIAVEICESEYPLCFRWYRAQPLDAAVELPDGRRIGLARIGRTADRTALAKRLGRLADSVGGGAALIILPDQVRLRHARRILRGSATLAFLSLEAQVAHADPGAAPWWIASANARLSLAEALRHAPASSASIIEAPLARLSMPRPLGRSEAPALTRSEQRSLDLIGDWPWLRPAHLADLLNCSPRRSRQALSRLRRLDLVVRRVAAGQPRLALSDAGLSRLARRDRGSVAIARRRWSVESVERSTPSSWRDVIGARSRQLLRHLAHTESVHRFVAQLAKQATAAGCVHFQLDPPQRASRYFRLDGVVRSIHPDAFASLCADREVRAFFLEYERRADRPAMMRDRLAPYLRYFSTRRPLEDHGVIPSVLVVFEHDLTAHHFLNFAEREIARRGVDAPLLVSSRPALERLGPLGGAWSIPGGRSRISLV